MTMNGIYVRHLYYSTFEGFSLEFPYRYCMREQWRQTYDACPGPFADFRESRVQNHCVNQSNESRMNDCIGILYSDSEFMDLTPSLILAPPVPPVYTDICVVRSIRQTECEHGTTLISRTII
jgi:hypothetical protein